MKLYPQSHGTDSRNDLEKIFFSIVIILPSLIKSLREWKIEMKHHARNFSNSFFIGKKIFSIKCSVECETSNELFHSWKFFWKFHIAIFYIFILHIPCLLIAKKKFFAWEEDEKFVSILDWGSLFINLLLI